MNVGIETTMTIDEFLERLSQTPRTWYVVGGLRVRCDARGFGRRLYCPITAVTGVWEDTGRAVSAGVQIGLSRKDAVNLVLAADNTLDNDPLRQLRQQLERACGLTNEVQS